MPGAKGTAAGGASASSTSEGRSTATGAAASSSDASGTADGAAANDSGAGALDEGMSLIRRKTIAIKSDNVSDVLMSNIGSISESVATFQKMSE